MPIRDYGTIHKKGEPQPPQIHEYYCKRCKKPTPHKAEKCLACGKFWTKCDVHGEYSTGSPYTEIYIWMREKMYDDKLGVWYTEYKGVCYDCAHKMTWKKNGRIQTPNFINKTIHKQTLTEQCTNCGTYSLVFDEGRGAKRCTICQRLFPIRGYEGDRQFGWIPQQKVEKYGNI